MPFSVGEAFAHTSVAGGVAETTCSRRPRDVSLHSPPAVGPWWARWEQAGWPFPGGSSLPPEGSRRVSRICNSHSEMVPRGEPLSPTRSLGGSGTGGVGPIPREWPAAMTQLETGADSVPTGMQRREG